MPLAILDRHANVPRLRIGVGLVVVNLADGEGLVAMLAEPAAQGHGLRVPLEVISAGMPVVQAQHERGTAGNADGTLRLSTVEENTFAREPVEVRRDRGLVAVATQPRGQIVGDQEQDVGFRRWPIACMQGSRRSEQQKEKQRKAPLQSLQRARVRTIHERYTVTGRDNALSSQARHVTFFVTCLMAHRNDQ